jgi:exopolyphosphatase / guanosine-5'-triphosphate,3'-diphosphate pyrophosphatase
VRRIAAVDIGSNTVHVLVVEVGDDGHVEDVARYNEIPELGARVDRDGVLGEEGRAQALEALDRVLELARQDGYELLLASATAAVRNAADGGDLIRQASERIGVPMRIVSGRREAELSFLGVTLRNAVEGPWLMADLGGGSTELVVAQGAEMVEWTSLPIGSGSFAARLLSDPPHGDERVRLRQLVVERLEDAPVHEVERFVVTGGTGSTLPLVLGRQPAGARLSVQDLYEARRRLDTGTAIEVEERTEITAKRVKALRAGVDIFAEILSLYGLDELRVSREGLRHGMVVAYLRQGEDWWRDSGGPAEPAEAAEA